MRTRLYIDPEIIEKTHKNGYPTIRQIFDEIKNKGNVNICLFTDNKDVSVFDDFINKHLIKDLIYHKQNTLKINTPSPFDIIADTREDVLSQTTHITLKEDLMAIIRWFVPGSNLLDPTWCLINSSSFILDMEKTMDYIDLRKIILKEKNTIPDYLVVESIYATLHKILIRNPELRILNNGNFYAERYKNNMFTFYYKDVIQ